MPVVMQYLKPNLQSYYLPQGARDLIEADNTSNQYQAQQLNFLHTFSHGDKPNASMFRTTSSRTIMFSGLCGVTTWKIECSRRHRGNV